MEKFSMRLPLSGDFFTTVRLTTGGLCALAGFDVDGAEDYKVCVTECLLILKRNGYLTATVIFVVGEALQCHVKGEQDGGMIEDSMEEEISHALLYALVDDVDFERNEKGGVSGIRFEG